MGQIRLLTLAPEAEGAIPFIERAAEKGIVIGLAHTNASEEILEEAYRAGARLSCHLGNGARDLLPRHRNPIQKQLAMDGLMASIIADGVHLPDYVVKNFIRAKGAEQDRLNDGQHGRGRRPSGKVQDRKPGSGDQREEWSGKISRNALSGRLHPDHGPGSRECR